MTSRTATAALALSALLVVLAACSTPEPAPAPFASATKDAAAAQVECVNIERAYTVWSERSRRPKTDAEFAKLTKATIQQEADAARALAEQVAGYPDLPAKALSLAVAEYVSAVATAAASLTIGGKLEPGQAEAMATAAAKVEQAYANWKAGTCA